MLRFSDGSIGTGFAGIGGIIRYQYGGVISAFAGPLNLCRVITAELMGLSHGLDICNRLGIQHVAIEVDAKLLILIIHNEFGSLESCDAAAEFFGDSSFLCWSFFILQLIKNMKILLLLLIISFGLMAIFTSTSLVKAGGDNKHNRSNFMNKELEGKNDNGKKLSAASRKEKIAEDFRNPKSKFVYGDSKKEDNLMKEANNKYYPDSINDAYPSTNGASIDTHHQISIDQYKRIIGDNPFHP
ncbi:hypothetical protein M5K25_018624 [Dendrobium thyrsiflorum]|uniref:RNase H type-1 domain-containing protein n=1 Tax=Dendrobium thyrsiflorum TaxID=117978 RepID=A0ABD0UQE5_DENTH